MEESDDELLARMRRRFDNMSDLLEGASPKEPSEDKEKQDQAIRLKEKEEGFKFGYHFQSLNVDLIIASALCNPDRVEHKSLRFYEGGQEFTLLEQDSTVHQLLSEWSVTSLIVALEPGAGKVEDAELRDRLEKADIRIRGGQFVNLEESKSAEMTEQLKWHGPYL